MARRRIYRNSLTKQQVESVFLDIKMMTKPLDLIILLLLDFNET